MLTKALIEKFYDAASIQRWNDHARVIEMTELDKQAHKMVIAYVIGKFEETGREIDWLRLIEAGIFEFLHRVILTDIKPPVFHKIMKRKGREVNEWVLKQLDPVLAGIPGGFRKRFAEYLQEDAPGDIEKRIVKAAHYLATNWEFKIIYAINHSLYGIERTREEIENELEDYYDLIGVQKISLKKKTFGFIDLCGQLRFQQRWAHTPRIPRTSVLGHTLIVAMMVYFCSLQVKACRKRIYNDFFAALFHDLPEVLTRDIIRPIKDSVKDLDTIIREYEKIQVEERLLPLLPDSWTEEMRFFLENEFENRVRVRGVTRIVRGDLGKKDNRDDRCPVDGKLIRACDDLAAFIEASLSIRFGIHSAHLRKSKKEIFEAYRGRSVAGIEFGRLFDEFD